MFKKILSITITIALCASLSGCLTINIPEQSSVASAVTPNPATVAPVQTPVPVPEATQAPVPTVQSPTENAPSNAKGTHIIFDDFAKINENSTLADVNAIVGSEGTLSAADTYEWDYGNDITLQVVFYEGAVSEKKIDTDDNNTIFIDSAVDNSKATDLYTRIENKERVSYDDFKAALGAAGVLTEVSYYSSGNLYYYKWVDTKNNYVNASFDKEICSYFSMY